MADYIMEEFSNIDIHLDEHSFTHCIFHSCHFIFEGQRAEIFNCTINNCTMEFRGCAAATAEFMKNLYQEGFGDWGKSLIIQCLESPLKRPAN